MNLSAWTVLTGEWVCASHLFPQGIICAHSDPFPFPISSWSRPLKKKILLLWLLTVSYWVVFHSRKEGRRDLGDAGDFLFDLFLKFSSSIPNP